MIDYLPQDMFYLIISDFLEIKSTICLKSTSKFFNNMIDHLITQLRWCNFSDGYISNQMKLVSTNFCSLTNLNVRYYHDPSVGELIENTCRLNKHLKVLISNMFTENTITNLPKWCPNIETLGICCSILDEDESKVLMHHDNIVRPSFIMTTLCDLKNLTALEIGIIDPKYRVTDEFYDAIGNKNLKLLNILGYGLDMKQITKFSHLISFSYPYADRIIIPDDIYALPSNITNLNFGNSRVSLTSIFIIERTLPKLKSFSFGPAFIAEIDDIFNCYRNKNFMRELIFLAFNSSVRYREKMRWLHDQLTKIDRNWKVFDYKDRIIKHQIRTWCADDVDIARILLIK